MRKKTNFPQGFLAKKTTAVTATATATATIHATSKLACTRHKEKEEPILATTTGHQSIADSFARKYSFAMVWNSPPGYSSPAEVQVCAIASTIGLDSERLVEVCQQMRKEYVVETWQLPDLDSRQWEQLKAPIGLAVAVKHISTQRRLSSESRGIVLLQEEEKEEEIATDMMCCDDTLFPSTSLSGWSSKPKEETRETAEVETKTVSEENSSGSKADQVVGNIDAQAASVSTTEATANETLKDDTKAAAAVQKTVTVAKNQPYDEKDVRSLDTSEKKTGFIEEYTEWLKQVIVTTTEDNKNTLSEKVDPPSPNEQAIPLVPKIDGKNDSNHDQTASVLDSKEEQTSIEAFDECNPSITAAFQNKVLLEPSDATKSTEYLARDASETKMIAESDPEIAHVDIQSDNQSKESEIVATNMTGTQPNRGRAESFDSSMEEEFARHMEEEFSKKSENVQSVTQKSTQQNIKSVPSSERESSLEPVSMEISHLEHNDKKGEDAIVQSIDEAKEYLEQAIHDNVEMEEMPDENISDTESEINRNIFSSIPKSASFSEDSEDCVEGQRVKREEEEDDDDDDDDDDEQGEVEEYVTQIDNESPHDTQIELAPISIAVPKETSMMVPPENFSDDITVAHSNVSPEGKQSASKRRNNARIYPHEYDRSESSSSFLVETASLQNILVELPMEDHRTVLSQLLIMTNARDRVSRTNLAFQVQDTLVALIEKHQIDVDPAKAVQIIFHLSRLKKVYREMFGKSLFKAMSTLYKKSEKSEKVKGKSSPKTKKKKGKRSATDKEDSVQDDNNTQQEMGEILETEETGGEGVQL